MPHELAADAQADRAWSATNLVGVPAQLIGSVAFNRHPVALSIAGTRESARGLFGLLEAAQNLAQACEIFGHFMELTFGLTPDPGARQRSERLRYRANYRKLLEGWGFDSNAAQGAVLKGWVESRFGLVPTFHAGALGRFPSPAWVRYIEQKMVSRFHGNCINLQLDLLYEYCQWAAQRFGLPARDRFAVWRGVNSLEEHRIVSGSLRSRHAVVQLNNVVSFSLSREHAEQFGDWILATSVPVQKLLFFPGLLGRSLLAGEGEVIALGGQYEVEAAYC
ncbi:MAG TPA: NAD(+)--dinitrogen-reductase ADP-D-ribosyltransferase [Burkholderiaceae bacterium]|nr:NAD(+)--dinitrogen-reductase ADP-D-ribosyltransferase [Burkholderiaceae bacterium]